MKQRLFTILLSLLLSASAFSQSTTSTYNLPLLGLRSNSLSLILSDIDTFIGNKPNGLQYPVSKIVFSEADDLLCFHVIGIDNTWTNLFKFGEVPYGYIIIYNRLYVVAMEGYNALDLDGIFYRQDKVKAFNRSNGVPPTQMRNPSWFFEQREGKSYLIAVSDLDVLD